MAGNIAIITALLGVALAQDYFDDRYKYLIDTTHPKDVPVHFEASGPDALDIITKYITDIQKTAEMTNSIASFDVQVTMERKHRAKYRQIKPTKPKKFKVPLKKKKNSKSSFDIDLRKYVSDVEETKMAEAEKTDSNVTTENNVMVPVTKRKAGKYRPYLTGVKPKYHKHVKPVPNKEIVLN